MPFSPKYAVDPELDQEQHSGRNRVLDNATIIRGLHHPHPHVDLLHIPSLTLDTSCTKHVTGFTFYEERLLCFLLHLNEPQNRVVYVTSMPVSLCVVDYYLSLLTDISMQDAKQRLSMVCCYDPSTEPLSVKILQRPRLMKRIKHLICPGKTIFSSYCNTAAEQQISMQLGIENIQSDVSCLFWGTKTGSRNIFKEAGIPHCFGGHEMLQSVEAIVDSVISLRKSRPDLKHLMVKLNEGVSGLGNASWELPNNSNFTVLLKSLMTDLKPCSGVSPEEFLRCVPTVGAIVEERIDIANLRSPSAQGLIGKDGRVEIVSTHEQVLHNGIFDGCTFPANEEYRAAIQKHCLLCGLCLASKGLRNERFGVDFLTWEDEDGEWQLLAVEINVRSLGTTHPMMTLQLVAKGGYLTPEGTFVDRFGRSRSYFAVDSFLHESLKSLTPEDLMDSISLNPILQYNKGSTTGTIFYMIDALPSTGKIGMMCIQEKPSQATNHFHAVKALLLNESSLKPALI